MTRSLIPDPLQMWREAITQLEGGINSLATRKMDSEEFAQALNQFSKVSLGMQHVFEKALASFFKRLDIPSRTELAALAAAVQRVEDKLDQLLPVSARASVAPRPPRTRRPPEAASPALAEAAAPKPPARPPARRTRKGVER